MTINKAAALALKEKKKITRMVYESRFPESGLKIEPVHERNPLFVNFSHQVHAVQWNPTADDLMADDWFITE